jgi:CheY-like chemotaxis protein
MNDELGGIGLLERTKESCPNTPVVMVTAVHDISVVLAAIRKEAYDYLLTPFEREQLSAPDLPSRWQTPAPDFRPALEVQPQTFRVHQRRSRLHSALTPADLPNTSLCFVSAAWASRPAAANYRCVSFSLVARFLSCKQRPSCAIEDTLPNGISWAGPTVNHCSAHGTWGHAIDRRSNHTPLP